MGAGEQEGRERQAALHQALRREVNERRTTLRGEAEVVEVVCECSDPSCQEVVVLSSDEYEFIRRVPIRLVVKPDHVQLDSERVLIAEPGRFAVVERLGRAGDVVAQVFDPRGQRRARSHATSVVRGGVDAQTPGPAGNLDR